MTSATSPYLPTGICFGLTSGNLTEIFPALQGRAKSLERFVELSKLDDISIVFISFVSRPNLCNSNVQKI